MAKKTVDPSLPPLDSSVSDKKTEFFLAASHQLKSPVAIVQWCLQSVLEDPSLSNKSKEWVRKALNQSNAMGQLITDMLHVFRLGSEQYGPKSYTAVPLNDAIDKALLQYEPVAAKKKVHLVTGPIEHLPSVYGNEAYIRQAVINLIDNAIKYTAEGGKVEVRARNSKGFTLIEVEDNGIGIPESEQSQMFREFFRGVEAQNVAHEGTGLGLVLVKHVMQQLGGDVTLKSTFRKGTTFTLHFPIQ